MSGSMAGVILALNSVCKGLEISRAEIRNISPYYLLYSRKLLILILL
jgi:hypothetical protein